jgi:hypothetical protein
MIQPCFSEKYKLWHWISTEEHARLLSNKHGGAKNVVPRLKVAVSPVNTPEIQSALLVVFGKQCRKKYCFLAWGWPAV